MGILRNALLVVCVRIGPALAALADAEEQTLDTEILSGRSFRFAWRFGQKGGFNGVATLRQDGTIAGIASPNETTWLVDDQGRLIFKHKNGSVSTLFDKVERRDGLYFFQGPFQFREGVIHLLEEIDEDSVFHNETVALNRLIKRYSDQQIFGLDIGETYTFKTNDGRATEIRLVSVTETRDSVIGLVRRAVVDVEVDGRSIRLVCDPYAMPSEIQGLKICADTTSVWSQTPKRVQLSIWDAAAPLVHTDRFGFPLRDYVFLSHGTQGYNEAVHLGRRDGDPQGQRFCHDYGFDIAGFEGREVIVSCTDGEIVQLHPATGRPWSVVVQDEDGLMWDYGHLDSISPNVKKGNLIRKGDAIGILGKTGPSGNFSHLHVGTYVSQADLRERRSNRRLNLYPWLVTAYQKQYGPTPLAVARPHQTVVTGERVRFDGSRSIASDAPITSYRWRLPGGSVVDRSAAEVTFDKAGVYVATLQVKDASGREDVDFCRVKVFTKDALEKSMPTIFMTHSPTLKVTVGQPVCFRFWLQARDLSPIQVDFGDGTVIEGYASYSELEHRFQTAGIHVVTASATVASKPITQCQKVIVRKPIPD